MNKKILPFVNAHVLIPTTGENPAELAVLNRETLNDGWNSTPTRGMADYWAWSLNRLVNDPGTPDVVDGYYIDESYGYQPNASLLTGAGYIQSDGTHGIGLNLLGAREKFNRLARILIAAGKAPNLWFHSTATMFPHMWSHGLMVMDGERPEGGRNFYVPTDSAASRDHFDAWNDNNSLLDPSRTGMGTWLLGIGSARKFGFVSTMWQGLECCDRPAAAIKQRRAQCLLQMHDVQMQDQLVDWWKPKSSFGIDHPATTFRHYASQHVMVANDPGVKVSYYQRPDSVLAYIANFGDTAWTGSIAVPPGQINPRWGAPTRAFDAESRSAVRVVQGSLSVSVPRHDCRVVQLDFLR